jgi:uncharacterized protein (UPF0332 family)
MKADADILLATMAKADEKLACAVADMAAGFHGDTSSRAYYAAFHAATAALATRGLSFSSHRETIGAFARDIVNTGLLPQAMAQNLQRLFEHRQTGDYAIRKKIDAQTAAADIETARTIVEACRKLVAAANTP